MAAAWEAALLALALVYLLAPPWQTTLVGLREPLPVAFRLSLLAALYHPLLAALQVFLLAPSRELFRLAPQDLLRVALRGLPLMALQDSLLAALRDRLLVTRKDSALGKLLESFLVEFRLILLGAHREAIQALIRLQLIFQAAYPEVQEALASILQGIRRMVV